MLWLTLAGESWQWYIISIAIIITNIIIIFSIMIQFASSNHQNYHNHNNDQLQVDPNAQYDTYGKGPH